MPELKEVMQLLGMFCVPYSCRAFGATYRKDSALWTNCATLRDVGITHEDLPRHSHPDSLNGAVVLCRDGHVQSFWKTSLVAAYVPDCCRAWAKCLSAAAPGTAFRQSDEKLLDSFWQLWLMEATGDTDGPLLAVPVCPARFMVPWRDALRTWCHKRPAMNV